MESDVDSIYDSYKTFTPDDTEDEKPKRKVAFSNTNRFFLVDDGGNQERVDLRTNLGDKVIGRCKATVSPAARPDSGCGISSPGSRWLEPTPPRCDGICYVCMYSRTHNALGTRCLYSLRVDYTSQNSYEFIIVYLMTTERSCNIRYIAVIPNRAFRPKKAHPGATQDYMESYLEQDGLDEQIPTTENSLYKTTNLRAVRPYSFRYKGFYRLPRSFQVRREGKSFTVAVQARQDKSSRRLSIPRCALPSNFSTPILGVYSPSDSTILSRMVRYIVAVVSRCI